MSVRAVPQALIENQHAASDPSISVWVSANAGAGKTHVLAQRVIRILLQNTDPAKILCLTFTKAAAANMANRIFETLGKWIALDDKALDGAIARIAAKAPDTEERARARRLFALALETPGGLKVQTIHGFCTLLLQQFPFEANVAAHFHVLEETEQTLTLEKIRRDVLLAAANKPDSAMGRALAAIIPIASDYAFQEGLNEAIKRRDRIAAWLAHAGGIDRAMAELSVALGIKSNDTLEKVEADIIDGPHLPSSEWNSAAAICAASSANDQKQGLRLTAAVAAKGQARLDAYLSVFITDKDEARKSVITATLANQQPDLARRLNDEQTRTVTLCERRRAVIARDRTRALLTIAAEVSHRYAAEKDQRGLLDFEDLITRTRQLLDRVEAAWVHYKLDLGVNHVLIDEAQDTSPQQWDIIKKFVAEFTAGAGARGLLKRSIFAVGDEKQSIFSFQGAVPEAFDEMRRYFEQEHAGASQPFRAIPLRYSFRSAPAVLDVVDMVFRLPAAHSGLTVDPVPTVHEPVRVASSGMVELWKLVEPDERTQVDPWDAPFDTTTETSPRVKLARQIARAVKTWIARGDLVGDGDERHAVRPGDILILVRQRGPLFESVIRALKNENIAVAGADRLVLTEHIAVMDLLALADTVLLPLDDLALATVLKSPLFNVSEDDLFALASKRKGSLHAALRARRPDLAVRLDAIANDTKRLSPFALYASLLGSGGGRQAFLARLGAEANDALDEFLNLALEYESRETPSLQGFVDWVRTASAEIKRDMEIARDEVRVMTVHGAKGLEAPVVVLADTTTVPAGPSQYQPQLYPLPARKAAPGTPDRAVWTPSKSDDTPPIAAARLASIAAAENEHRRLLYVAMTRAEDRLVVCGAVGKNAMPQGCWYDLVRRGLEGGATLREEPANCGDGTVWRYGNSPLQAATKGETTPNAKKATLPEWLKQNAPVEKPRKMVRPSDAEEEIAPVRTGDSEARRKARERGNHVHRLMQSLPDIPVARRAEAARQFLARRGKNLDGAEREAIVGQVLGVLDNPIFAPLFAPGSHAEAPIVGRDGDNMVVGQVDRLVVAPQVVLIADYKTNTRVPHTISEAKARYHGYIRQLALYRAVLMRLYPDRPVRAALVWTEGPVLMAIPDETLDSALAANTSA